MFKIFKSMKGTGYIARAYIALSIPFVMVKWGNFILLSDKRERKGERFDAGSGRAPL